ncbi:MAG TPA: hypothetical protein VMF61_04080 [Candidatus Acidoferrales bacterium]|nr:hypothetical protein [Candidatus Acidoferrales bacterium]
MKRLRKQRFGIVAVSAVFIAGCSGTAMGPGGDPVPEVPPAQPRTSSTTAQFTIRWPANRKQIATSRGPRWISPSGASIIVVVNGDAKTAAYVNAPAATGKPSTTTTDVDAPAGRDTFAFTLYDRTQKSAGNPVGNVVGAARVTQKIAPNATNVIKVAVAGVVGAIAITEAPGQPFVAPDSKNGGFDFLGDVPGLFAVTAQDVDGNTLVPQPADLILAPSVTSTAYLKVTRPKPDQDPQNFQVALIQGLPPGQKAAIVATATDAFGNHAENSATVTEASAIYAAYDTVPSRGAAIVLYNGETDERVSLPSGAFAGLGKVPALAYDSRDQELFAGDGTRGLVVAFDPAGKAIAGFKPIRASGIVALAYDPDVQQLYVTARSGVAAYSKAGTPVALSAGAFAQTPSPGPLAFVQPGAVAVGQKNGGGLGLYSESGEYATGSSLPLAAIAGIATDYTAAASFVDVFVVGKPIKAGEANLYQVVPGQGPLTLASLSDPRALAQDPGSKNVYVASGARNQIIPVAYGTWVHRSPIPSPSGYSTPIALAIAY